MVYSIITAGNLNANLLSDGGHVHCAAYTNSLANFYLTQHVMGPSRVTATSSTLIDHNVSSPQVSVLRSVQKCGLSEHRVQIVNLDYSVNKVSPKIQHVVPFKSGNGTSLNQCCVRWHGILCTLLMILITSGPFFILFWRSV